MQISDHARQEAKFTQVPTWSKSRNTIVSLIAVLPLIVFYNAFVDLEGALKFSFIAAVPTLLLVLFATSGLPSTKTTIAEKLFVVLMLFAILRVNSLDDGYLSAVITALISITVFVVYVRSGWRLKADNFLWVLFFVMLVSLIQIQFNHGPFFTYVADLTLGTLSIKGYQLLAQFYALVLISGIFVFFTTRSLILKGVVLTTIVLVCSDILQTRARGEALAIAFSIIIILGWRAFFIIPVLAIALPSLYFIFQKSALFERIVAGLELDPFAARDILWNESFELWLRTPVDFFIGGGLNWFQSFYAFKSGNYPHNLLLEAANTGGILLLIVTATIFVGTFMRAIFRVLLRGANFEERCLAALYSFYFIISLKSGTLVSIWILAVFYGLYVSYLRKQNLNSSAK